MSRLSVTGDSKSSRQQQLGEPIFSNLIEAPTKWTVNSNGLKLTITNNRAADEELFITWAGRKRIIDDQSHIQVLLKAWHRSDAAGKFAHRCGDAVYEYLRKLGVQRPGISDDLAQAFSESSLIDKALELLREGHSPVLVLTGDQIKITADFLLALIIDHPHMHGQPMIVVPIRDILAEEFSLAEPTLPKRSTYSPAMRVLERAGATKRERSYKQKGLWDFKLI